MSNSETEVAITNLVRRVDWVRENLSGEERDQQIANLEAQIQELKKATGPRIITGVYGRQLQ
jgi:uncharacterized membrane protein YukC